MRLSLYNILIIALFPDPHNHAAVLKQKACLIFVKLAFAYRYGTNWNDLSCWLYKAGETKAVGIAKTRVHSVTGK